MKAILINPQDRTITEAREVAEFIFDHYQAHCKDNSMQAAREYVHTVLEVGAVMGDNIAETLVKLREQA